MCLSRLKESLCKTRLTSDFNVVHVAFAPKTELARPEYDELRRTQRPPHHRVRAYVRTAYNLHRTRLNFTAGESTVAIIVPRARQRTIILAPHLRHKQQIEAS
jgi:hypothetical protein